MPTSKPSAASVVARLRAAGCVFAEDEAAVLMATAGSAAELSTLVERRAGGLPLEQVVGWAEFCGLRIIVDPGVFVPRRRTEFLVERAVLAARRTSSIRAAGLASLVPRANTTTIVDLCCGSGAVGVALARTVSPARLYAVDIDPAAVRCAVRNLAPVGGHALQGDLYAPLPAQLRGRVDIVVANVPYVPTGSVDLLPAEARLYEPRVALDGGADGLDVFRRVVASAADWLTPGGSLLVEAGEDQVATACEAISRAALEPAVAHSAERDTTVVSGRRPAPGMLVS
jgi:release factor glutamine methyltransferase